VNPDAYNKTIATFSMWTYEYTNKYLMVVDLQGVVSQSHGIVLTDAAILCHDVMRFGATNLGPTAIDRCLKALESWKEIASASKSD